jgi:hypothetical protein
MKRNDLLVRLHTIRQKGLRTLQVLDSKPQTAAAESEARTLVTAIRHELQFELNRLSVERSLRSMTLFEVSIYAPTISAALHDSGLGQLHVENASTTQLANAAGEMVVITGKHIR